MKNKHFSLYSIKSAVRVFYSTVATGLQTLRYRVRVREFSWCINIQILFGQLKQLSLVCCCLNEACHIRSYKKLLNHNKTQIKSKEGFYTLSILKNELPQNHIILHIYGPLFNFRKHSDANFYFAASVNRDRCLCCAVVPLLNEHRGKTVLWILVPLAMASGAWCYIE